MVYPADNDMGALLIPSSNFLTAAGQQFEHSSGQGETAVMKHLVVDASVVVNPITADRKYFIKAEAYGMIILL